MIKAQYSWGSGPQDHAVGLITEIGPRQAFIHASSSPPDGSALRLKMPQVGKSGAVEVRGVVAESEGQKLAGFVVEFSEFIRGEAILLDFLGVPRSGMLTPVPAVVVPEPEAETEPLEGEVSVRIGVNRPIDAGHLVDVSDSGLYLRTGHGDEPWQLKQKRTPGVQCPHGSWQPGRACAGPGCTD